MQVNLRELWVLLANCSDNRVILAEVRFMALVVRGAVANIW